MKYFVKRIVINVLLTVTGIIIAVASGALFYEIDSGLNLDYQILVNNLWFWVLIIATCIYNIVASIVIKENHNADIKVLEEVKANNYEKLFENYIEDVMENASRDEKRKVLKNLEKEMKKNAKKK